MIGSLVLPSTETRSWAVRTATGGSDGQELASAHDGPRGRTGSHADDVPRGITGGELKPSAARPCVSVVGVPLTSVTVPFSVIVANWMVLPTRVAVEVAVPTTGPD